MSSIAHETLQALATHISTQVTALSGRVGTEWAANEQAEDLPRAVLLPRSFKFEGWRVDEVAAPTTSTSVCEIGSVTGTVELRLAHFTPAQRETLETAVLDLFMLREDAPGVLTLNTAALTIMGTSTSYQAPVSFELEDWTWNEERAFTDARFTYIDLTVSFPILVLKTEYRIERLQLLITRDLTNTTNPVIDETVQINSDGSLTAPT